MSFEKQNELKTGLIRKLLFILKIILGCKSEHDPKKFMRQIMFVSIFVANGEGELLLIWLLTYFTDTGNQESVF